MADQHGFLVALTDRTMGDQFLTAASIGATTLSLGDVSNFDEGGGLVRIAGVTYTYDSADMDADTIHLTSGLTAATAVGDRVDLWDGDNNVIVSERVALVSVDDQDGDPISATVGHSLEPLMAQGTLVAGQSVTMTRDPDTDEWFLSEVHGKNNTGLQRSTTGYFQVGVDNYDGTATGLEVDTTSSPWQVRLLAQAGGGGVRVQAQDRATYLAIAASAFNISSDAELKTDITDAPDALGIVAAAPAKSWRYLSDPEGTVRVGPMAQDLPASMTTADPGDGHLSVDLARMVGVLWTAVQQLTDRIAVLEEGA